VVVTALVVATASACGAPPYPGVAIPRAGKAKAAPRGAVFGPISLIPHIAASGLPQVPSLSRLEEAMDHVHPAGSPADHYAPGPFVQVTSDGVGGSLTVAIARRVVPQVRGSVPATGFNSHLAFFWHDTTFVGVDNPRESLDVYGLAANGRTFTVDYRAKQGNRQVTFQWDGRRFVVTGRPPGGGPRVFTG
jgi:hypothetical protein